MIKVHILRRDLSTTDAGALRALLIDAGCPSGQIDVVDHVGAPGENSDEEVVVTVLSSSVLTAPDLEVTLLNTLNGGRRTIGVWPKNCEQESLPPAVLKYCFSVVPWDPDRIRLVVTGEDYICFESPRGEPLETPSEEHRICPKQ
jgi:hypothetical protein